MTIDSRVPPSCELAGKGQLPGDGVPIKDDDQRMTQVRKAEVGAIWRERRLQDLVEARGPAGVFSDHLDQSQAARRRVSIPVAHGVVDLGDGIEVEAVAAERSVADAGQAITPLAFFRVKRCYALAST